MCLRTPWSRYYEDIIIDDTIIKPDGADYALMASSRAAGYARCGYYCTLEYDALPDKAMNLIAPFDRPDVSTLLPKRFYVRFHRRRLRSGKLVDDLLSRQRNKHKLFLSRRHHD